MTKAEELLTLCRDRNLQVTTAESCTGGMVAAAITDVPGSSDIFERGYVTYSNAVKTELLGVSADTLATHGAVSHETVREMAEGALVRAGASLAVAISGIAGPGGSEFKPEGRVCFALAARARKTWVETIEYGPLGRDAVRRKARDHALTLLTAAARRA